MSDTKISPFVVGEIKEVELTDDKGEKRKYWRKEILPSGKRQYNNETLDFSIINPSIVKAFEDGARDSVPFVLALPDNQHPQRGQELDTLEGDLHKLELSKDGSLFGYFDLSGSEKVQSLIKKTNGKLGVSGRIDVDYERKDIGKKWDYALSHVCGTTGPHIKGMKPWESVDLSEVEDSKVIDFSTEIIDESTNTNNEETGGDLVAINIPQADYDKLMKFIKEVDSLELPEGESEGDGRETTSATLSEKDQKRFDLAEENARKGFELAEKAHIELAETRWSAKRAELVREGVPPVILSAAEKVLKFHKRPVITLSDNQTVDAASVIEEILDACKGTIKLNEEKGHSVTDSNSSSSADKEYEDFEKNFFAHFE